MDQDRQIRTLLSDVSDESLLKAFDRSLIEEDYEVMWRLVDEIECRRLDL